jgi:hypothetical protein
LILLASLTSKFRGIFWIATCNFVIPVFLSLVTAIFHLVIKEKLLTILYIDLANGYISIIAVVFATLWASRNAWYREHIHTSNGTDVISTFRARRGSLREFNCSNDLKWGGSRSDDNKPSPVLPLTSTQVNTQSGDGDDPATFSAKEES